MKYLIEIHHGIGDVVQMSGVIETLYYSDPDAEIGIIVYSENRAVLFKNDERVKWIYMINLNDMTKKELLNTVISIRRMQYDYAFISPISNKRAAQLLGMLIGAKITFGEQFVELSRVSKSFRLVQKKDVHIVERNNNVLLASGLVKNVEHPKLIGIESIERIKGDVNKLVGVCIGTSKPAKTWPLERYVDVAIELECRGYGVVFIGGKDEADRFPIELFQYHSHWYNYLGKVDLLGSAALTAECDVVLGGDTGIMHIAAAVDTPTVTIFSCSDPKYHAPYSDNSYIITTKLDCQYCYAKGGYRNCKEYKCINQISVEQVISLLQKVLDGTADDTYRFIRRLPDAQ